MYKYYYDQTGLWICKVILSSYVTKCGQSLFWVKICLVFSVQKTIFFKFHISVVGLVCFVLCGPLCCWSSTF